MSSSFLEKFAGRISVLNRGGVEAPVSVVSAATGKEVTPSQASASRMGSARSGVTAGSGLNKSAFLTPSSPSSHYETYPVPVVHPARGYAQQQQHLPEPTPAATSVATPLGQFTKGLPSLEEEDEGQQQQQQQRYRQQHMQPAQQRAPLQQPPPSAGGRAPSPLNPTVALPAPYPAVQHNQRSSAAMGSRGGGGGGGPLVAEFERPPSSFKAPPQPPSGVSRLGLGALRTLLATDAPSVGGRGGRTAPPSSSTSNSTSIPIGVGVLPPASSFPSQAGRQQVGLPSLPPRPSGPPPEMPGSRDFVGAGRPYRSGQHLPPVDKTEGVGGGGGVDTSYRSVSPITPHASQFHPPPRSGTSSSSSTSMSSSAPPHSHGSEPPFNIVATTTTTTTSSRVNTASGEEEGVWVGVGLEGEGEGERRVQSSSSTISAPSYLSRASSRPTMPVTEGSGSPGTIPMDAVVGGGVRGPSYSALAHYDEEQEGERGERGVRGQHYHGYDEASDVSDAGVGVGGHGRRGLSVGGGYQDSEEEHGDEPPVFADEWGSEEGDGEDTMLYKNESELTTKPLQQQHHQPPPLRHHQQQQQQPSQQQRGRKGGGGVPNYEPLSPNGSQPGSPAILLDSTTLPMFLPTDRPPRVPIGSGKGGGALHPPPSHLPPVKEERARRAASASSSSSASSVLSSGTEDAFMPPNSKPTALPSLNIRAPRIMSGKSVTYSQGTKSTSPLSPTDRSAYAYLKPAVVASMAGGGGEGGGGAFSSRSHSVSNFHHGATGARGGGGSSKSSSSSSSGFGGGAPSHRGMGAGRLGASMKLAVPMIPIPGKTAVHALTILPHKSNARVPRSNDELIKEEGDKLLFSRKPRHTNYTPATLADFNRLKAQTEAGLSTKPSSLGPNWESESRLAALDSRKRAEAYAAAVVKEAKAKGEEGGGGREAPFPPHPNATHTTTNPTPPLPPGATLRKRIEEYSRTVPPPRSTQRHFESAPPFPQDGEEEVMQTLGWSEAARTPHAQGSTQPFALSKAMRDAIGSVKGASVITATTAKAAQAIGWGRGGGGMGGGSFESSANSLIDMEVAHERAKSDVDAIRRELQG